jgi:NADPH-dependent stearoyl-CoA 9-desaturase
MAITDVAEYAHLSVADLEALAADLEAIRRDIEDSRGAKDRTYIRRTIAFQRGLEIASRLVIGLGKGKVGWVLGTTALAVAKSIENMELAHNIGHGQWDWMNDPEIHSTTWERDMVGPSSQWRYSHNYRHHVFTNVVGVDEDLGYRLVELPRLRRCARFRYHIRCPRDQVSAGGNQPRIPWCKGRCRRGRVWGGR